MTVSEAVKQLLDMPQDAQLVICGHEFPGMENQAWPVIEFDKAGSEYVLVEGAHPNIEGGADAN